MKLTSELIRKAHKMTREIKEEFPNVDYKFQFGLCMSYLLKNKEDNEMVENEEVIYTHECHDQSNYHLKKSKHWAKLVKSIDKTKTDMFAFEGEWLSATEENIVHVGDIILEFKGCKDRCYSLIRVLKGGELEYLAIGTMKKKVSFIKECYEEMYK